MWIGQRLLLPLRPWYKGRRQLRVGGALDVAAERREAGEQMVQRFARFGGHAHRQAGRGRVRAAHVEVQDLVGGAVLDHRGEDGLQVA